MIRRFNSGVTLLGGGPWRAEDLATALTHAPALVCADGGANALTDRQPDLIIGDLDSLNDKATWTAQLGDDLIHDRDQNSTDFEKCLAHVAAPFVIGVGFIGGRIDHELAVLSAMTASERPIVVLGEQDVMFAPRGKIAFPATPGQRVSIFPFAPLTARSHGLKWPLEGLSLAPGGQIGTSNEANSSQVQLEFDGAGALVVLPKDQLRAALAALCVI